MLLIRLSCALLLSLLALTARAETEVQSFSPRDAARNVRQVRATFSAPMVAFGEAKLAAPFEIACAEPGSGQWADERNWIYDFAAQVPSGTECTFTLKPDTRDLNGKPLAGARSFRFSTGGPTVLESQPSGHGWAHIDENQVFILALDGIAQTASIEKNVYCSAAGINEEIGVRLLHGKARDEILALRKQFVERHLENYFKAHGRTRPKGLPPEAAPLVVLQCQRTLPPDADIELHWGANVASENGLVSEEEQRLSYHTRADFSAQFSCTRAAPKGPCIPLLPMTLQFSAPVPLAAASAIVLRERTGAHRSQQPVFSKEEQRSGMVTEATFKGPFAPQTAFELALPPQLKDESGRALLNLARFPLTVLTGEQPALLKFPARFGIIEAHGDRMLPVTVRNLEPILHGRVARDTASLPGALKGGFVRVDGNQDEKIIAWMKRLNHAGAGRNDSWRIGETGSEELRRSIFTGNTPATALSVPTPGRGRAFEVIGIPLKKNGFYVVEMASPKLGAVLNKDGGTAYVQTAALVTNLAAHFKHGAESSLVWVTSLDKGLPVAGADVAVRDCRGGLLWKGRTGKDGIARIATALNAKKCGRGSEFFISARTAGDMTFTLSDWVGGIETYRFHVPTEDLGSSGVMVTTVMDRTLLRVGETVHMKHFLRNHSSSGIGLVRASLAGADAKVVLTHVGSDERHEFPLKWRADGSAETVWTIPADARQGVYEIIAGGRAAGSFRVEQFRVPTMKAMLLAPRAPLVAADQLTLDVQLNYLSGGAAAHAPVTLRTLIDESGVSFPGHEDFSFSAGDVVEGRVNESDDNAMDSDDDAPGAEQEHGKGAAHAARTRSLTLDQAGAARIVVDGLPHSPGVQKVLAELEYRDANGEAQTASTRVTLWPSALVLGIHTGRWAATRDRFKFQVLALDPDGKPHKGAAIAVDLFQRITYSHRRRLLGGFYAYENGAEIKRIGPACEGSSNASGMLECEVAAPASGNLIVRARSQDEAGRTAVTHADIWVAGEEEWWFRASDSDRIDLLPERKRYEPGQDATFQVRMPFRSATALVSVEREGILATYVRHLSGRQPTFTIPIKGHYAPNVFVSALVVRGRVGGVRPGALVDLGKPAYKMGIAQINVGWQAHELKVAVDTDKAVYRTRETAHARVRVRRADGRALPAGSEVTLAAVDAGLLELMPNDSWNLLEAMMQPRGLQVETSTAQMQVIGKRHFGRKAVAHGGGGGRSQGRELFDTLLLWKGRVALDAQGEATVDVPLNDSLTEFRIVAVASAGAGLFGTGSATIRATQDLILTSGLPSAIRDGDRQHAVFTVRNTSADTLALAVEATLTAVPGAAPLRLPARQLTLGAGQAAELGWDVAVPAGATRLQWDVSARSDRAAADRLRASQTVLPSVPTHTYQATLLQLDGKATLRVQAPADALPGRGGVQATLMSSLGQALPGVRQYMAAYPYSCFEQISSKALALKDEKQWQRNMAALPSYLDKDGLLKYFPLMEHGSETLTAYVLSAGAEAGYPIAAESRERMEQALVAFVEGRLRRTSALSTADLTPRKLAALEALSRSGKVRPELLESIALIPEHWPSSALLDWYLVLKRTTTIPQRAEQMAKVEQILRTRLDFRGSQMKFSTARQDELWWLMTSGDANANRLLLAMLDNPRWQADLGRIARGTLARQSHGHWDTTVANAWGVLALDKFSARFETQAVAGSTSASLKGAPQVLDWSRHAKGDTLTLAWPAAAADLTLAHHGSGKPWALVQSVAAVPLQAALTNGYAIRRSITAVAQKQAGSWSRGDVYRVHLDIDAQADMTWVVVDDPIPAGATILGSGLGRDSAILTRGAGSRGGAWPAFEERKVDAFRSYFEFVPRGRWSVEYTVRLNNSGQFSLPPTRVEAMYAPDLLGELPNRALQVGE